MEWISILDKKPENDQVVIAYGRLCDFETEEQNSSVHACRFIDWGKENKVRYFWSALETFNGVGRELQEVTHWMPMPDKPKE